MSEELIDIIDKDNNETRQEPKSVAHDKGLRHRVCAALLKRSDGKYLIPTAANYKTEAGGLWHSSAGHVKAGESCEESMKREIKEECGIKVKDMKLIGSFWFERDYENRKEKEKFEVFEIKYNESMGPIKLNEEQVNEKWLSLKELKDIYINNRSNISEPLIKTCELIFNFIHKN